MIFRYSDYSTFLVHLRTTFPLRTFRDWQGENGILLRHDVDFDLAAAHRLAVLEHEHDVRATFFVRTASATYNPMSAANRWKLVDMARMGFEIALHFDPSIYGDVSEEVLQGRVRQECAILESIVDCPVTSLSLHNPSVHGQYVLFPGYLNAYDPRVFSPDMYISDSRMEFRQDIYEFVERAKVSPIQVLLHPLHFSGGGSTYPEIVCKLLTEMVRAMELDLSVNSTYLRQMKGDALLSRLVETVIAQESTVTETLQPAWRELPGQTPP